MELRRHRDGAHNTFGSWRGCRTALTCTSAASPASSGRRTPSAAGFAFDVRHGYTILASAVANIIALMIVVATSDHAPWNKAAASQAR